MQTHTIIAFLDSASIATWVGIIVGVGTIIGGLIAFFAKNKVGKTWWSAIAKAFLRLRRWISLHRKKTIILLVLVVALVVGLVIFYFFLYTQTVTGTVYYLPCEGTTALDPAPNVTVSVSGHPGLKSLPSGSDGKFTIPKIPRGVKAEFLTARFAGQDYPPMAYRATQDYVVVAHPPCATTRVIREVSDPWVETTPNQCESDEGEHYSRVKRFVLESNLYGESNKHDAALTVERQAVDTAEIMNAFVLLPTVQSQLYRNDMAGVDKKASHRWVFSVSPNGLRVKLELCVGSNDPKAAISPAILHTYYELR